MFVSLVVVPSVQRWRHGWQRLSLVKMLWRLRSLPGSTRNTKTQSDIGERERGWWGVVTCFTVSIVYFSSPLSLTHSLSLSRTRIYLQTTDIVNAVLEGYPKSKKELYVSQCYNSATTVTHTHTHTHTSVVRRRRLALRLMKIMVLNYQLLNLTTCTLSPSPISLCSSHPLVAWVHLPTQL